MKGMLQHLDAEKSEQKTHPHAHMLVEDLVSTFGGAEALVYFHGPELGDGQQGESGCSDRDEGVVDEGFCHVVDFGG
jgi:hypothetical protein